ncbi:MAG: ABC transporter permease [Devosia sp.]|nr:ABC transporter permease [Devosia sp.]
MTMIDATLEPGSAAMAPKPWRMIRWNLWIGLFIVLATLLLSILAPYLPLSGPNDVDYHARLAPPSFSHFFGTDNLGRDMFSRVVYGAQIDLAVGFVTVAASMVIGVLMGLVAASFGGIVETIIMRVVDALLAFPFIVLVLAIVAVIGPGLTGVIIGMIGVGWTVYARITFSEMRALRERQFMLAAQTLGYRRSRILLRHALPNVLRPNIAFSISDVVLNILGLAGLSYLGAAVKPPTPEWGALISAGQAFLQTGWWISTLPGVAIVIVGIGFSLLGEGVADALGTTSEAVR